MGISHILNLEAIDHILFIAAMVAVYKWKEWKHVIILATAFTLGHSTTLALATFNVINVPGRLIEFLIALTIFITGLTNLFKVKDDFSSKLQKYKYMTAMFFGLIHGLGFSTYLRFMLAGQSSIVIPLLAFNVGVEFGQIVIITIVLFLNWLMVEKNKVIMREWNLVISGMAIGVSMLMMIDRFKAIFIS